MSPRIEVIDSLRGLALSLMVLDHARDFFYHGTFFIDPTALDFASIPLFFTRWITHFCAPAFVLLAGVSARLLKNKLGKKEIAQFLFIRGMWLLFLEFAAINLVFSFDLTFSLTILQVIWAIGLGFLVLSTLVYIPDYLILVLGVAAIVCQFWLKDSLGILLNQMFIFPDSQFSFFVSYPPLPWIGILILGYVLGKTFAPDFNIDQRKDILLYLAICMIACFIFLRLFKIDLSSTYFIISFLEHINTEKYPPSVSFVLMTIPFSLLYLRFYEHIRLRILEKYFVLVGGVSLFFYVAHFLIIHLMAIGVAYFSGTDPGLFILTKQSFINGDLANYGFSLGVVYFVWVLTLVLIFPMCNRYREFKMKNKDMKWISYI